MDRINIIQNLLNQQEKFEEKTYMEIGVENGLCFSKITAPRKIGIDPASADAELERYLLRHPEATYYQIPSDDFFEQKSDILANQKIDVAFVDGLHTYDQSLRDVENCLKHLGENGIIVIHDCNPASAQIAGKRADLPPDYDREIIYQGRKAIAHFRAVWSGDVWKTIVWLRCHRDDLNVFVLDCDYGVGIISKGKSENMLEFTAAEIEKMTYENLDDNRELFLNLKNPEYLFEFMKTCEVKVSREIKSHLP